MVEFKDKLLAIHQRIHEGLVPFFKICLSNQKDYNEPAPFHYELSDVLLKHKNHFAVEMYRESAKSSYVLKAFPLYRLTYPIEEERYIVIIKQNQDLASAKLVEILNEYEASPVLKYNLLAVHKRSAKAIELTVRGKNKENVRVRIEAYGKGASIRGLAWGNLRPQIIIGDDLQDFEDSKSEVVLEKDWDWFLGDIMFLAKTGRIFLIGNNLGKKCIIERVIDSGELGFEFLKIAAMDQDGNATWPSRFSKDFLEAEKAQYISLGKLDIWYRERMCEAIAPETQLFREEYFHFFEESDLPQTFDIDITIDPAISKRKDACNSSIVAVAKNSYKPDWYVLDYKFGKWSPYEIINNTFDLYRELKGRYPFATVRVYIEGVAYQEALRYVFEEEMKRANLFMFLDTFVDKTDKNQRIQGLVPMVKIGVLHFRRWMTHLKEEALMFPVGRTVDILDALSFHQHIKTRTSTEPIPKKKEPIIGMDGNMSGLIKQLQSMTSPTQMSEDTYLWWQKIKI